MMWNFTRRRPLAPVAARPFVLGIRQLPAQWLRLELPLGLNESEALSHARRLARQRSRRCSLQTPTGRVFWINARGRLVGSSRSLLD
jgi:hypothetical protein